MADFKLSLGLNEIYFDLTSRNRKINDFIDEIIIENGELSEEDYEKIGMLMSVHKIKKQAKNKFKIYKKAERIADKSKEKKIEKPDDDWLAYYDELVSNVSDEQMQEIWARILVREHIENGSISKAMLNVFSLLDKDTAATFQKICTLTYLLNDDDMGIFEIPLVLYDDILNKILENKVASTEYGELSELLTRYQRYCPTQQEINLLDEIGLLKISQIYDENDIFSYKKRKAIFQVGTQQYEMESFYDSGNEYEYILTGQAFFTQLGLSLYHALQVEVYPELYEVLVNFCEFNEECYRDDD